MPNKLSHILDHQMGIIKGLLKLTVYHKKYINVSHNGHNTILETCKDFLIISM